MPVTQTIGEDEEAGYIDPAKLEAFLKKKFPNQEIEITVEAPRLSPRSAALMAKLQQGNKTYKLKIPRKLTQVRSVPRHHQSSCVDRETNELTKSPRERLSEKRPPSSAATAKLTISSDIASL